MTLQARTLSINVSVPLPHNSATACRWFVRVSHCPTLPRRKHVWNVYAPNAPIYKIKKPYRNHEWHKAKSQRYGFIVALGIIRDIGPQEGRCYYIALGHHRAISCCHQRGAWSTRIRNAGRTHDSLIRINQAHKGVDRCEGSRSGVWMANLWEDNKSAPLNQPLSRDKTQKQLVIFS